MTRFVLSPLHCHAYRVTTYDTPLWVFENTRAGRWGRPGQGIIAQYLCLDPAAPMAEYLRNEGIDSAEVAAELRLGLWQLEAREGAVVDLSSPEAAANQGVEWETLTADDWEPCQDLAAEIIDEGGRGVVAPSAALPGSLSLTLFGPRSEFSWNQKPSLASQIPARHVLRGAPMDGVVVNTRHFGMAFPRDTAIPDLADLVMRS